jgi:hypothetical protein
MSKGVPQVYQLHQSRCINVCVNLCGGNVSMAKQCLQNAQIRTALKQMGRKSVAQDVRAYALWIKIGPRR